MDVVKNFEHVIAYCHIVINQAQYLLEFDCDNFKLVKLNFDVISFSDGDYFNFFKRNIIKYLNSCHDVLIY